MKQFIKRFYFDNTKYGPNEARWFVWDLVEGEFMDSKDLEVIQLPDLIIDDDKKFLIFDVVCNIKQRNKK